MYGLPGIWSKFSSKKREGLSWNPSGSTNSSTNAKNWHKRGGRGAMKRKNHFSVRCVGVESFKRIQLTSATNTMWRLPRT